MTGAARALAPGGMLLLTYRDLSNALHGVDRAIPVRSTDDRIMLCFLDFTHAAAVATALRTHGFTAVTSCQAEGGIGVSARAPAALPPLRS